MLYLFDFRLLIFILPAILLGIVAQFMVSSAYASAGKIVARLSGFATARRILDNAGLNGIDIEQTPGHLSDHYDSRHKVLRLSPDVYHGQTLAAVSIAAHEAGHALQDARGYLPLMIRNAAVPASSFGSGAGMILLMLGVVFGIQELLFVGIILFGAVVFFQIVNLPVEFNASSRAKLQLEELGIVGPYEMPHVSRMLRAAALTYVAATLQSILTLLYYVMRFTGDRR